MIFTNGFSGWSKLTTTVSANLKKAIAFFIFGSSLLFTALSHADKPYSFGIEYGIADDQIDVIQIDLVRNISAWFDERVLNVGSRGIGAALEFSALHWTHELNSLTGVSSGLRFDYDFDSLTTYGVKPFVEYGLAVGLISDTVIAMRDLSTAFHFKNQLGIGLRTKGADFFFRISHFSNASIAEPNDGLNILTAGLIFAF